MRAEMNLIESWVLPDGHPVKRMEREKAEQWRVDFSRQVELGFVAVHEWVVIAPAETRHVALPDAA